MTPRWLHRFYARVMGYFWLACPRCGEMFGGHEVVVDTPIHIGELDPRETYKVTCPSCTKAGVPVVRTS